MTEPRWLADEMLGRLARYLRFFGYDTVYARNVDDDQLVAWSARDGRTLLTRDRQLAQQVPGSIRIDPPDLEGQLRALRAARPGLSFAVRFDRCTVCNGVLRPWVASDPSRPPEGLPPGVLRDGRSVFACTACGKFYWEGSHTAQIRRALDRWFGEEPHHAV